MAVPSRSFPDGDPWLLLTSEKEAPEDVVLNPYRLPPSKDVLAGEWPHGVDEWMAFAKGSVSGFFNFKEVFKETLPPQDEFIPSGTGGYSDLITGIPADAKSPITKGPKGGFSDQPEYVRPEEM